MKTTTKTIDLNKTFSQLTENEMTTLIGGDLVYEPNGTNGDWDDLAECA